MWSRKLLKTRAKEILKKSYWKAFLVSIVIAIVGGGRAGGPPSVNFNSFGGNSHGSTVFPPARSAFPILLIMIVVIVVVIAILVIIALRIFVGYPLEVGGRRFFIEAAEQKDINLNHLGSGFEKGNYLGIVKAMLWKDFLNFLWYLLLFIPGIIKSYSYAMVPYLLADNPNLGAQRALNLSRKMTSGHKFRMFVLDLSFIGWYLLAFLALVVGVLFILPYVNATKAELYMVLRQSALDRGLCSPEELD